MKQCTVCKSVYPLDNFHRDKRDKSGLKHSCKPCNLLKSKQYQAAHPEKHKKRAREWYYKNKDNIEKKNYVRNKTKRRNKGQAEYIKNRKMKDPVFRITVLIRDRFIKAIRGKSKKGSAVTNLGMSIETLLVYLNLDCIDKYGEPYSGNERKYHIDHIRPLSSFDLTQVSQLKIACNWSNLQILTIRENISKGYKIGGLNGQ
jgi:hypothetical protein